MKKTAPEPGSRKTCGVPKAFIFYIAFFTIAVFNILTGIFVEKALHMSDQADRAVEYMKQEREDATLGLRATISNIAFIEAELTMLEIP